MKKIISVLLTLLLMLCSCSSLAGDSSFYAVVSNPNPVDRLNLRSEPSRNAYSMGKYLNGVVVRVLGSVDSDWAQVCIGQTVGYMMKDYLVDAQNAMIPSAMMTVELNNPYADGQWLLEGLGNDAPVIVKIPNGASVTILGIATDFAHIQYGGVTGYVPLDTVGMEIKNEKLDFASVLPSPAPISGEITRAVLVTDSTTVELLSATDRATLSALLSSTEYYGYQMAGCPFGATLMLTFSDGRETVIELASDSCCVYRYDGHDYRYARSFWTQEEGVQNDLLFSLFGVTLR